jgi:hypothetical protein
MKRWQKVVAGLVGTLVALGLVFKLVILRLPPSDPSKAVVGSTAPAFALDATTGTKIALADLTKDAKAVLVFYRGDW